MARLYGDNPELHARALRALANLRTHTPDSVFCRACRDGEPLILGMADGTQRKATILSVEPKSFATDEGSHAKLDVLYAMPTKSAKQFKKVAKRDAEIAAQGNVPSPDVHKRLQVSKMVFQRLIDESLTARYVLLDGTIIPCRTRTFGFFEVNVEVRGGGAVTILRHGLHRILVGDEVLVDIARGLHVQGR